MSVEQLLAPDVRQDFMNALEKVAEAQDAFESGEVLKAAGILASHGRALLNDNDQLGQWFVDVAVAVRCALPINP